jgi:hypothetical protein
MTQTPVASGFDVAGDGPSQLLGASSTTFVRRAAAPSPKARGSALLTATPQGAMCCLRIHRRRHRFG